MAAGFLEEGKFTDKDQGLCCNYVAWTDGTFSCDLVLGN